MVAGRSSGRLQHQLLPLLTPGLIASGAARKRMREGVAVEEREGVVVMTTCGERNG